MLATALETRDYGMFKTLDENRWVSDNHIKRLVRVMEEYGNITERDPIMVNERYEVIDGQHRLVACKLLNLPVFYTVVPGMTVSDARQMNMLRRNWNITDYARSYAVKQPDYQTYLDMKQDYGFGHGIMLHFIRTGSSEKGHYKEFREGNFKIDNLADSVRRLNHLAEIAELVPDLAFESGFAYALRKCMDVEGYDEDRMTNKVRQYNSQLKRFAGVNDNLRQLEDIYNHNAPKESRVRFF